MRCGRAGRQLPFNEMFDFVQGQRLEITLTGKGFFHDQLEEYFEGSMQMSLYHTSSCDCNTSFRFCFSCNQLGVDHASTVVQINETRNCSLQLRRRTPQEAKGSATR